MRFTRALETDVLAALRTAPTAHLVFDPADYRADGRIMTYRDNLGITLQHRLYRQLIGPVPRGQYLRRNCPESRCVNPYHYRLTKISRARPANCPNGHPYTPDNTLPTGRARCRACKEALVARTRSTRRRAGYCLNEHRLTEQNAYLYTDAEGRVHRRCKICHLEKVRARRARQKNTETGEHHD